MEKVTTQEREFVCVAVCACAVKLKEAKQDCSAIRK